MDLCSVTRGPFRVECSTITTASALRGPGAPVMISTVWPGSSAKSEGSPARVSPISSSSAGTCATSAAMTAKPSRAERLKGG